MVDPHYLTRISCTRAEADAAALADSPLGDVEPMPTLVAMENAAGWELQMWTQAPPDDGLLRALAALAPSTVTAPETETVADADWVTLSQIGLEPVDIGRFHIHAREHRGESRPGQWPIRIDAGLAFGTGQHATTAGCIAAAARTARLRPAANILDVGTGSGLLAFAARRLHPRARLTAADLDPVAVHVARENARINHIPAGHRAGHIALMTAPGVEHPLILGRAPYDLVFANILAGPLAALAPSLSSVVAKGGTLILAGLLQPQAQKLISAYSARGLRLVARSPRAEWPVLVFRKVKPASRRSAMRGGRREAANRGWKIDSL
ncbi:MAG: 50S ribosomal protein L11 methyltransferase [Sphingomonadaceae bacterium]